LSLAAFLGACSGDGDGEGAADARDDGWAPETFTLANGMEVVVVPDHRVPVVTHMVWYKVGAADEPEGQSGIAHFLEHLMFKGTDELGSGEFSEIVAANGGTDNAFTSWDYTAYYQRVALDRLEMFMRMEADRMTDLAIPEGDFYSERDVIAEEIRIGEQDINRIMNVEMSSALWPRHPYGVPIGGWLREATAITPENVMDFYNTWYAPNNAILVVAGDITAEELRPLAEEIYGVIPSREVPERARAMDPPSQAAHRVSLEHELAGERYLYRYYHAPSTRTGGLDLSTSLQVGVSILDGGTSDWLYRELVIERGLATTAGAGYWGSTFNDGRIAIFAVPNDGVGFEELEAAMDEIIAEYLANGPTDAQLSRTKYSMIAAATYARDSQVTMAQVFGSSLTSGETMEQILGWTSSIDSVTREAVIEALAPLIVPSNSITGTLSPRPPEMPQDVKSENTDLDELQTDSSDETEDKGEVQ